MKGKRKKKDVQEFGLRLADNVLDLHQELRDKTYRHGGYQHFKINDPKPRDIHKAVVRDRLLHHAVYRKLYPFFDRTFIADSFSCRIGKGTHRAMNRFRAFARKASLNHTRTVWVLKCDIRKFFASIDQKVLIETIKTRIPDGDIVSLLNEIVGSFHTIKHGVGLPLGNLTSQLLVNIYMNEFDQFVKHKLRADFYIRYADDFVILSRHKRWLEDILVCIREFLDKNLHLLLHPGKISIRTFASGVDYLGWVHFSDHRVLRTSTRSRMFNRIRETKGKEEAVRSYLGLISHGNTRKLRRSIIPLQELHGDNEHSSRRAFFTGARIAPP